MSTSDSLNLCVLEVPVCCLGHVKNTKVNTNSDSSKLS